MRPKTICGDLSMTGKYYVITGCLDWADEFDVHFFEVLSENTYNKYMIAKKVIGSFEGCYGFGSNEWFDEFDFLGFEPKEITEEQYKFLNSIGVSGHKVFWQFMDIFEDARVDEGLEPADLYKASLDEFEKACKEFIEVCKSGQ